MGSFTQWGLTIYQITNEVFRESKINKYLIVVKLWICPTIFFFLFVLKMMCITCHISYCFKLLNSLEHSKLSLLYIASEYKNKGNIT